jgi:hypothetical protein
MCFQLSWASLAAVELFQPSWTSAELNFFNCSWAFSAAVELSQLHLNFNFNCEPLWPYTSWTCLWSSWTGVFSPELSGQDQLNWSLGAVKLVPDPSAQTVQQSASQTGRHADRSARGGSTASLRRFNRILVKLTRLLKGKCALGPFLVYFGD